MFTLKTVRSAPCWFGLIAFHTKHQLKHWIIQSRPVMLWTISSVRLQIVSHSRSTTSASVLNTSFLNPMDRIYSQICSMGFISGVYGGIERSWMFSGMISIFDLCQAAPSQTSKMKSSGYCFDSWSRNTLVQFVLQNGIVRKKFFPFKHQMHNGIPGYDGTVRKDEIL